MNKQIIQTQSRFSVLGRAAFLLSKGHEKFFQLFLKNTLKNRFLIQSK